MVCIFSIPNSANNCDTKDQLIYVTCQNSVTEYVAEVDSLELDWLLEGILNGVNFSDDTEELWLLVVRKTVSAYLRSENLSINSPLF